jgi:tetratricopeptide (TPR) repeat protein
MIEDHSAPVGRARPQEGSARSGAWLGVAAWLGMAVVAGQAVPARAQAPDSTGGRSHAEAAAVPGDAVPPPSAASEARAASPSASRTFAPPSASALHGTSASDAATVPAQPSAPTLEASAGNADAPPPARLDDLAQWLEYKTNTHTRTLPYEARLFFRRGMLLSRSGANDEAIRLARGAVRLDPTYLEPRLTLIAWLLPRSLESALQQITLVIPRWREDFSAQWTLAINAALVLFQSFLLGLAITGFLLVITRNHELRHGWHERLRGWSTPLSALFWSWVLFLAPFVLGFGIVLPTVLFLAMLWAHLKLRERILFFTLIGGMALIPFGIGELDRLSSPMRPERSFLPAVLALESEPYSPQIARQFADLAAARHDDPYVQFGTGWLAQQGNDLSAAEQAYQRVLELWPNNDRVLNNLANVLVLEGRYPDAMPLYQRAFSIEPHNATVLFNLSQAQMLAYDFKSAQESLAKASALDFDLVRGFKEQPSPDGTLPLQPQWLAPKTLWKAVLQAPRPAASAITLPPAWKGRIETSGWRFAVVVVVFAVIGYVLGGRMQKGLPIQHCSNCAKVVCRRCSGRHHTEILCRNCAEVLTGSDSPDFMRILLTRQRDRSSRLPRAIRAAFAAVVPAAGLIAHHRIVLPFFLLWAAAMCVSGVLGAAAPYRGRMPRLMRPLLGALLVLVRHLHRLGRRLSRRGRGRPPPCRRARQEARTRRTAPPPPRLKKNAA